MDEQQLQQLVQSVAQALSQGADPNQIMQQLMQKQVPEDAAKQIIQAAMQMVQGQQEGGEMQGAINTEREAQGLIEQAVAELGPEVMLSLLKAFMGLSDGNKQALMEQLNQMATQNTDQGNGAGVQPTPEEQQALASQENMFGLKS